MQLIYLWSQYVINNRYSKLDVLELEIVKILILTSYLYACKILLIDNSNSLVKLKDNVFENYLTTKKVLNGFISDKKTITYNYITSDCLRVIL